MPKCPSCKGTGQQTLTVIHYGKKGSKKMKITCVVCKGGKEITPAQQAAIKREKAMWCRCKTPGDPQYHDTGDAHFWTCSTCRKVTQVG